MESGHRPTGMQALDMLGTGQARLLLDLGTGNGWAMREMQRAHWRAVGVDTSMDMLRLCRRHDPQAQVVRARFDALPFRASAFDAAFSMEALYYAPDLEGALAEAARVLAAGARFSIVVDRYVENEASHDWDTLVGLPLHLLSEKEWGDTCAAAGFKDVATERLRQPGTDGQKWTGVAGSLHVHGAKQTATEGPSG